MRQMRKFYAIPLVLILALFISYTPVFSQEGQGLKLETPGEAQTGAPAPEAAQAETLWIWGEVISVDATLGQILVRYLDYETGNEVNITIDTESTTTYENVAALAEIKPKDTVSIDYVTSGNKNIAKNISVEKLEAAPEDLGAPSTGAGMPESESSTATTY